MLQQGIYVSKSTMRTEILHFYYLAPNYIILR